jgi:DNA-binding CsgD family transcriptional regulator
MGRRIGSPDLTALGLQALGRILIANGDRRRGTELVDEAMTSVLAGELSPFVTGWVYCNVLGTCLEIADLGRAGEWTAAASAWCESLPDGSPYHALCRLYRVEVVTLKGAWPEAERDALRATEQLMVFPGAAGHAFYAVGEIRRRMGDLRGAEEAFKRAHALGRDPHPGLALVRLGQGKVESASAALRTAADRGGGTPLTQAALLAALVEVSLTADDLGSARAASQELASIAEKAESPMLDATAAMARGAVRLAEGDATGALQDLRSAGTIWQELELPYEDARTRILVGLAARHRGDHERAQLELEAAHASFERLGAAEDLRKAAELLGRRGRVAGGLTGREVEVLRLVASGKTNRDIARDLYISERTVARHLQNIFTKLGLSSRRRRPPLPSSTI